MELRRKSSRSGKRPFLFTESLESRRLLSAGDLDPTFGQSGLVETGLGGLTDSGPVGVTIRASDGDVIVGGNFGLAAFTSSGVMDTTFGDNGVAFPKFAFAAAMVVQTDGKIILAGTGINQYVLTRYSSAGVPDNSFGTAGTVLTNYDTASGSIVGIAMQSDGKVLLAVEGKGPEVIRYNTNGSIDTTFGTSGTGIVSLTQIDLDNGIAVQQDGKIVVTDEHGNLVRLLSTGVVETSFAGTSAFSATFDERSLTIGYDGSIIVAGSSLTSSNAWSFSIERFTPAGNIDTTFGTNGTVTTNDNFDDAELSSISVRTDGSILAVGEVSNGVALDTPFALARFGSDGSLDPTFGSAGGVVTASFGATGQTSDDARTLVQTTDGHAIVVGVANGSLGMAKFDVTPYPVFATLSGNSLNVTATDGADSITIAPDGGGNLDVTVDGFAQSFPLNEVSDVSVSGGAGDDAITIASFSTPTAINFVVDGGNANGENNVVTFTGTAGDDTINVGAQFIIEGNLSISLTNIQGLAVYGLAGNDAIGAINLSYLNDYPVNVSLYGGDGNDTLYGFNSNSLLNGGAGNDTIYADDNRVETVIGGGGNDSASYDTNDVVSGITTILNSSIDVGSFIDVNSNGIQDSNEESYNGPDLYVDLNNNGSYDVGEPAFSGQLKHLAVGSYIVRIISVRSGWVTTTPSSLTFQLAANQIATGMMGYHELVPTGSISGVAFYDPDANSNQNPSEPSLAGRTIFLDLNGNGVLDSGEPSQVTSSSGTYSFTGLPVEYYQLNQVEPAGFWSTRLFSRPAYTSPDSTVSIPLGSSDKAALAGTVYYDFNADGIYEPLSPVFGNEYPVTGRWVYLDLNGNGVDDNGEPATTVNNNGYYVFPNITPGSYTVSLLPPSNNYGFQSSPAAGSGITFTAAAGKLVTANFGYAQYAQVRGTIFNDSNDNGKFDSGESGISGWTVFADYNHNGKLDTGEPSWVTGADGISGQYVLSPVIPGNVNVGVITPTGWVATSTQIAVASNLNTPQLNIGFTQPVLTANAGGPYSVTEGASVTLSAAASTDVGATISKYEWALNYTGSNFVTSGVGQAFTFSAAGLDGPSQQIVGLRVTDSSGQISLTKAIVNITDAPPTASFSGSNVTLGSAGTVAFSAQADPSPADVSAGFKYSYDFNDDGTFDVVNSTSATATVPASYLTTSGAHTIKGRIIDKDGGFTDYTATVNVTADSDPATITLQAETATLAAGTVSSHGNAGYTGTGYADYGGNGSSVTWATTRVAAGAVALVFRYANGGTTNRPLSVVVNGTTIGTVACVPTGGWTKWTTVSINANLKAGSNTIKATANTSAGGANVDSLTINTTTTSPTITYQGESAVLAGGTVAAHGNSGYTGTGYADFGGANSSATFTVARTSAGSATLTFRYANGGTTNRPVSVTVNGKVVGSVAFPATGSWTKWASVTLNVSLLAGSNSIKLIVTGSQGPNLDWMSVG